MFLIRDIALLWRVCNQNPTFYIVDYAIPRAESHYPDVKPFKILIMGLALWFYQTRGSGCKPEPAKRRTFHDWAFTSINCSPPGQGHFTITTKRETKAIVLSCEISVKNGPKSFLLSGHRELLTMKRCMFKTSKQEMSLGL